MAKAKGIRVNQLAKELGIPSKLILERCKTEGLGDKVPNHMTVMSLGLAETVREWFTGGEAGGTAIAVETATEEATAESEAEAKSRIARRRKKKDDEGHAEAEAPAGHGDDLTDEEATAIEEPPVVAEEVPAPVAEAPASAPSEPVPAPVAEVTVEIETPATEAPPAVAAEAPVTAAAAAVPETPASIAAPESPAAAPIIETPAAAAPVAAVAAPAPAAAPSPEAKPASHGKTKDKDTARKHSVHPRQAGGAEGTASGRLSVPTKFPKAERKPVVPAPQLLVPAPAKIQGPRIVREEKPEVVSAPRRRTPLGTGQQPSFVQARPQSGRGVRSTTDEETEESAEAKKKAAKSRSLSARRRGPDGRRGEADEKLREWSDTDLAERQARLDNAEKWRAGVDGDMKKRAERGLHGRAASAQQRGEPIELEDPITIRTLSAALGIKTNDILLKLMRQGVRANINQALDHDVAEALALDYGIELRARPRQTAEDLLLREIEEREPDPDKLQTRPPVVTILGHVDHGKTSLLDKIRSANVAAGESGGITQHIAAWKVELGDKRVTFIDTPGHQAFTSMRARGANMTDVIVLVVSAAEGVQPQTIESINHAKAAGVPIVVAMNKIDRPDANPDMVLGQLAKEGLNPVEWGGEIEVMRTSAITGEGIPELIEILDYQSQLLDLKADPTTRARGMVIESRVDEGLGAVATVLVQDGTLRAGDVILAGKGFGRVRSLWNDRGQQIQEAGPAMPVIVSGLNALPNAGEKFYVLEDMEQARTIAEDRANLSRETQLAGQNRVTSANLLATVKAGNVKTINLIIKGDVQGSVETLAKTVTDHNTEEVKVKVIHAAVGGINESDVELAAATKDEMSGTVIIGFHVAPDEAARSLAEQRHVEIRLYKVIYEIFDDLKKALSGMLEPEVREKLHGHVEIRQVFKVSRMGNIAGCMVTDGHIQRGSKFRLIRNGTIIVGDLALDSLKRLKDDVREVKAGFECGLKLANYDDIKVGDVLEAYSRELIHRTL